jgi:hypothetical protein
MCSINTHHATTQVDFNPVPHEDITSIQFGTLYNGPNQSMIHANGWNRSTNGMAIGEDMISSQQGNFTSASHNHNVLAVQGNYFASYPPMNSDSQKELCLLAQQQSKEVLIDVPSEEINQCESGINMRPHHDFDIPSLDGSDYTSKQEEFQHQLDSDILLSVHDKIVRAHINSVITREEQASLSLEEILLNSGSPLYLYDKIMKWAISNKRRFPSRVPFINRKKLYSGLSRKIYREAESDMMPREVFVTLPSSRRSGVTVFNIYSQITSLLNHHDLNKWSNYFFHPTNNNAFNINKFQQWDNSVFKDIETSIWYERTYKTVVNDPDNEILVPICLFIDSTVLSMSGSLSLEPVMMSLMIHNRETRKNPEGWLPLGDIHDPMSIVGNKYARTEETYSDYHSMLTVVLSDLMQLVDDTHPGLNWHFDKVPGVKGGMKKKLIFCLAFIIGGTKGHDILCGRMGSHNLTPGLCRDCDALTMHADDPSAPCNFLKQSELLLKSIRELRAMSFYRIPYFTFDRLTFGASPYGVNCATAIDIIHGLLIGMMQYLYATFVDQLTKAIS